MCRKAAIKVASQHPEKTFLEKIVFITALTDRLNFLCGNSILQYNSSEFNQPAKDDDEL